MLNPPDHVSLQFDSLNLTQIINKPTRYDNKCLDNASLLDVILTNTPDRYQSDVFCNDISDHCFIACIRKKCMPNQPSVVRLKRSFKNFNEQAFLHDPSCCEFT